MAVGQRTAETVVEDSDAICSCEKEDAGESDYIAIPDPDCKRHNPKPECSICRQRHGLEVIHACE